MFVTGLMISVHNSVRVTESQLQIATFGMLALKIVKDVLRRNRIDLEFTVRVMPVFDIRSVSVSVDFISKAEHWFDNNSVTVDNVSIRKLSREIRDELINIKKTQKILDSENRVKRLDSDKNKKLLCK